MPSRIIVRRMCGKPDSKGRVSLGQGILSDMGLNRPDLIGIRATLYANGELRLVPVFGNATRKEEE